MISKNPSVYSVTQVNAYVKNMFAQDYLLNRISVRGEVSNVKYHTSGHIYFSLKDKGGQIACVMFASSRRGLAFTMKEGDQVIVTGSVSIFDRDGKYQLYAKQIVREGLGLLYERFLELKAELMEMGMFDPAYKQPIPTYVRRLGVVTAPTGAAIQDIRNISLRRNPYLQIILYPALVQGEGAAESIVQGIEALDELGLDVIIVGRGGGSIEDLWAFNEEKVARAIFACRTPIISAVGHETDTTISDYVADLRAPTPSAAAELAVADIRSIINAIDQYTSRLNFGMNSQVLSARQKTERLERRLRIASPETRLLVQKQWSDRLSMRLEAGMQNSLTRARHQLELDIQRFKGLSPLDKLNQGFSYVEKEGKAITRIAEVAPGDLVTIQVTDGQITAQVQETRPEKREASSMCRKEG